jgi:RNA polymerase sigma factor (sigma-70 family)
MEREVVAAACEGDAGAFAAVVEEFTPTVLAAAFGWCGDRHLAADIAQEVFATAYVKIPTLRDPAALPGWLMAITRSSARVARPRQLVAPIDVATPGVDDEVVAADEARRLRQAVEALPATERLPMALHYFAGLHLADIAELCGLPLSTVKKRMRTARGRIRRQGSEMIMDDTLFGSDETRSDPSDVVRIFSAMRTGDAALVAALLDSRPDLVDVREDWTREESRRHRLPWMTTGGTPLLRAVERGDTKMVELLLSRGADPDARCSCEGGENPVWVAAAQHDKSSLELLLAHGADPNRPAFAGLTPLDVATVRGYDEITELLRHAGGRPSTYRAFVTTRPGSAATGIKAIDLWCPLPQRGLVHLAPGYGLGAIVLISELSRRAAISGQRVVWTGFVPSPLDLGDLHHAVAESGIAGHVVLAMAAPAAPDREKTAALDAGMAAAADGGLLVVFNEIGHLLTVDQRLMELAERPGTTIVVAPLQATSEPPRHGSRPFLASIAFDATRAARGRWPAISSESWSLVATPRMATLAEHARLAMTDELDQYLSQPFHVAEHILGIPGETVESAELHSEVSKRLGTRV